VLAKVGIPRKSGGTREAADDDVAFLSLQMLASAYSPRNVAQNGGEYSATFPRRACGTRRNRLTSDEFDDALTAFGGADDRRQRTQDLRDQRPIAHITGSNPQNRGTVCLRRTQL
jgi:hypothetical protein